MRTLSAMSLTYLNEIGRQLGGSVAIVEGERGGEGRRRYATQHGVRDDDTPARLAVRDGALEELVQQQVAQLSVLVERLLDVAEEHAANDAAASPHQRDLAIVEVPVELLGRLTQQHEALRVRDDLRRVQGATNVLDELGLVAGERGHLRTRQLFGRLNTFVLQRGQATSEHRLADQRDRYAEVEGGDRRPFTGALLAGRIANASDQRRSVFALVLQNVGGDLDEERVELGLVPLLEHLAHLVVTQAEHLLHDVVGLTAQLHVAVLDAVVHHLHVVTGTIFADPIAARLAVRFGRDLLEDVLHEWPGEEVGRRMRGLDLKGTNIVC